MSTHPGTTRSVTSLIAGPMRNATGTESVIVIAMAIGATSATAEIERVIATTEIAGMTVTAVRGDLLILSMGAADAEDDEPSNRRSWRGPREGCTKRRVEVVLRRTCP